MLLTRNSSAKPKSPWQSINIRSMKTIIIFVLAIFSQVCYSQISIDSSCNCSEPSKMNRLLNAESARLTLIPKFNPLIPFKTDVTINGVEANIAPSINWQAGARLYYYAPNSILSFGSEINFVNRSITINDNNHIEFNIQDIELSPFLNIKTGKFDKLYHLNLDLGIAYSKKLYSIVNYFTDYRHIQPKSSITNTDKLFSTIGIGLSRDIFRSNWDRVGLFSIGVNYYHPIKADFFDNVENTNPIINDYRLYSSKWQYFTVTLGTHIFFGRNNNPYQEYIFPDSLKKFKLLRTPNYYDEPDSKFFGGINFSIGYQQRTDTIVYVLSGDTLKHRFKSAYNYTVGYNLYFGNYSNSNIAGSNNSAHYNLFLGPCLIYRNYTVENDENLRYHTLSIGANSGLRFGFWKGIYLTIGSYIFYNLKNETLIANNIQPNTKLFKDIDYAPYIGVGFRNILSFSVNQTPLVKIAENQPSFFKGLEWKVGVGF